MPPRCSQRRSRSTSPWSRSSPFAEVSAVAVLAFRPKQDSWIEDRAKAEAAYVRALQEFGRYESVTDFAFLFIVLLLAGESTTRRLGHSGAASDSVLNQDIINEEDFRQRF